VFSDEGLWLTNLHAKGSSSPVVVIVDDNPCDIMLLEDAFTTIGSGTILKAFADWKAAFAGLAQETIPDVLILDFSLPGDTGMKIAETLRTHARYRGLPIVLFSGLLSPQQRNTAESVVDLCLEKPVCLQEWQWVASRIQDLATADYASVLRRAA
jgi:CheY-like chemotaxis protein